MALGDKLRDAREAKGLKQNYVATLLDVTNQALSNWERGERDPDTESLRKLADIYNVSVDYLLGRDLHSATASHDVGKKDQRFIDILNMLDDKHTEIIAAGQPLTPGQRVNLIRALDSDMPAIPIAQVPIVATIRAGVPILTEDHISGHLDLASDTRADFAVQITGDSMLWAGIHEGDYALCRKAEAAHTGQMVVAAVEDTDASDWGGTIKYFVQANGRKILRAANPEYKDIVLGNGDRIVGVVVAVLKEDPPALHAYEELLADTTGRGNEWASLAVTAANYGLRPREVERLVELFAHVVRQVRE